MYTNIYDHFFTEDDFRMLESNLPTSKSEICTNVVIYQTLMKADCFIDDYYTAVDDRSICMYVLSLLCNEMCPVHCFKLFYLVTFLVTYVYCYKSPTLHVNSLRSLFVVKGLIYMFINFSCTVKNNQVSIRKPHVCIILYAWDNWAAYYNKQ